MGWTTQHEYDEADYYRRERESVATTATYTPAELRTLATEFIRVSKCDLPYQLFLGSFLVWLGKQESVANDIDTVLEDLHNGTL